MKVCRVCEFFFFKSIIPDRTHTHTHYRLTNFYELQNDYTLHIFFKTHTSVLSIFALEIIQILVF